MTTHDPGPSPARRLVSIDAYRGLVMLLMMGEVLHFKAVAKALPESDVWRFLAHHQDHVEWVGCSLHDLIQPSFSFLVGVALPFSLASRSMRGQSRWGVTAHALRRALTLILLGIFLRSMGKDRTNYTFEDTLTQIGLGYPFLFALGSRPLRDRWIALAVLLVGYWAAFALYPLPGPSFDYSRVGVPKDWPHLMTGFAAHWNKNSNLAGAFDTWFLNLFPRKDPFPYNGGGYATLSFLPTLGTMILGLIAGDVLRSDRPGPAKVLRLVLSGVAGLAAGWALGSLGICPVVKRIWTPSWVLFSGGWCFLALAAFYTATDLIGRRAWAFPLVVVGANSIAAYLMSWLFEKFIGKNLEIHLGHEVFEVLGMPYAPLLHGAAILLVLWLILLWMYRRGLFLKI
jgi:heparan-alpha-glucosaminide N-acetyltransferase